MKLFTATLAVLILVTGCGGSSPADDVATAAGDYFKALSSGNYEQACKMLTPDGRNALRDLSMTQEVIADSMEKGRKLDIGCAYGVAYVFDSGVVSKQDRAQMAGFRFDPNDIKVNGTTAMVPNIGVGAIDTKTQLIRIGGKWLVDYNAE